MQTTPQQVDDQSNNAPLVEYKDASMPAPKISGWPINPAIVAPFVDTEKLVTFTASVPLSELIYGGVDGLTDYCMQAFASSKCTDISSTEFRVIGGSDDDDSWKERFQGDVWIQVTCVLHGE